MEKVWRAVLEGALLEARCGNVAISRKVFKFLMASVPWYGPIYYEAYRLEEKMGCDSTALDIIDRGLVEVPRYGPLWFGAFRVCERLDAARNTDASVDGPIRTRLMLDRALHFISKELVWKVHFEGAQMEERVTQLTRTKTADLDRARRRYMQSVVACPINLRWKVWLAGGRMEASANHLAHAVNFGVRSPNRDSAEPEHHNFIQHIGTTVRPCFQRGAIQVSILCVSGVRPPGGIQGMCMNAVADTHKCLR